VKGVGKSEIPVYIDVLGVKGTINVRLLLSATPPFVRTATFSFPCLPEFDISAKPLRRGSFNAMELPGMKTYVQKSIAEVAKAFVRPESYSIDVDRLLLGREASLRTHTVGVLHIVLHGAEDLPKTDTVGKLESPCVCLWSL
jgi:Ca2+-dependent lipid-binding protein